MIDIMYNIGDKFRPNGRTFSAIIYEITNKEYNLYNSEILYCLKQIVPQTNHIIYDISENALNENYKKINSTDKD